MPTKLATSSTSIYSQTGRTNYNAASRDKLGGNDNVYYWRALYLFDISAMGAIDTATLYVYCGNSYFGDPDPDDMRVYRISRPNIDFSKVGWTHYNIDTDDTVWTTEGGDVTADAYCHAAIDSTAGNWWSCDVASLIRAAQADSHGNIVLMVQSALAAGLVDPWEMASTSGANPPYLDYTELTIPEASKTMLVNTGATSVTTYFQMKDSTTHLADDGLTVTDFHLYYLKDRATLTDLGHAESAATLNAGWESIHAIAVGYGGLYRIDWPDAAFNGEDGTKVQLIVVGVGADTEVVEAEIRSSPTILSADLTAVRAQTDLLTFTGTDVNATGIGDRLAGDNVIER